MKCMTDDISPAWEYFHEILESYLEQVKDEIGFAYERVVEVALSACASESDAASDAQATIENLVAVLRKRQDISLDKFDITIEVFLGKRKNDKARQDNVCSLKADLTSAVDTALIGVLMADTYRAANHEGGKLKHRPLSNFTGYSDILRRKAQREPPQKTHY
jgi:hypothetical protein